MSAPLLNGAYPQQGIGGRIHRYVVIEVTDPADDIKRDELVLLDWIATEVIERHDARLPEGTYEVNAYVPTNQNRLPRKYRGYLTQGSWPAESLHRLPSHAWSAQMRHWEHEVGAAKGGTDQRRNAVQYVKGKSKEERERDATMLRVSETRLAYLQQRADQCRAQWIAAVHAEDEEARDSP